MDLFNRINSEISLAELLDSLYDGVYVVDPQRRIIFWNKAAEKMTGYSREEVLGRSCGDNILNHIDDNGMLLCRSLCPILRAFADAEPVDAKVYPKSKSGKRFPVETHISVIRDEHGKPLAAIEVFRDISQQEDYRILQEKFNHVIRQYVSTTTYSEVRDRIHGDEDDVHSPRILDLTVFYLDVVNFTAFSEKTPPQDVVMMLNELFGICEVITKECFGDIDKFIGDAVMAVFADANDAVRAAISIVSKGLPEMNRIRIENNETPIGIRIGINSGMVLQGDIGSLDRKDLTVIGDTVNVASRLEKGSMQNRILISEATFARLDDKYLQLFEPYGEIQVKGKSEKLKTFINQVPLK